MYTERSTRYVANTGGGCSVKSLGLNINMLNLNYRFFAVCSDALGLENGSLPGSVTASSATYSAAAQARLRGSKGWATRNWRGQWLQVALNSATNITSIATQGHHRRDWWTERFLLYSSCDGDYWQPYGKVKWNIS